MKKKSRKAIQDELAKEYACYVLITCDQAGSDGKMQVEMSYEGDPTLAAYLLHGAQDFLEEEEEEGDPVRLRSV
jgi:hypothetical protein